MRVFRSSTDFHRPREIVIVFPESLSIKMFTCSASTKFLLGRNALEATLCNLYVARSTPCSFSFSRNPNFCSLPAYFTKSLSESAVKILSSIRFGPN